MSVDLSAAGTERRYSFLDAIGLTFTTAVKHWRACLTISVLYAGLLGVANAVSRTSTSIVDLTTVTPSEVLTAGIAAMAVLGVILMIYVFVGPVTLGALSLVGSAAVYGDRVDTRGIIRRALERSVEAIGTMLLTVVALAVPPFLVGVCSVVIYLASRLAGFAVLVFGLVALVLPLIYIAVRLSLALPVVMREGRGPIDALRRSWALVGGVWWWVFSVEVVAWAVLAMTAAAQYASLVGSESRPDFLVGAVVTAVAVAIATILYGVALGVVYAARVPEEFLPPDVAAAERRVLDAHIGEMTPEKPDLPATPEPTAPEVTGPVSEPPVPQ